MFTHRYTSRKSPSSNWIKKGHSTAIRGDIVHATKRKLAQVRKIHKNKKPKEYTPIYTPSPSQYVDLFTPTLDTELSKSTAYSKSKPSTALSTVPMSNPKKVKNPYLTKKQKQNGNEGLVPPAIHDVDVVDLTQPTSFEDIKKSVGLFFTYDPTGGKDNLDVTVDLCPHCRCPQPYCVDIVFGPMCYKHTERLICKLGFDEYEEDRDITHSYKSIYTDLIKAKMLMNDVTFKNVHEVHYMKLPRCIRKGNLRKLIDDVHEWKDREDEAGCWSSLDATESELMARFQPPPDYEQNNYDYSIDFSKQAPDEEGVTLTVPTGVDTKRTAVEQVVDVSPRFKMVKKMVKDKMKRDRESASEIEV